MEMSFKGFPSNFLQSSDKRPNETERIQGDENRVNSIKSYDYLKSQFKMLGRSELTERMLRRIIKNDNIPKDSQAMPLYINLLGIIDELMLNELEIALWAIYLENLVWKNFDTYTEQLLLFSAYKAKQYFNGNNIEPYRMYLIAKINDFEESFQSWIKKYELGFKVDLKMINQKLNMLKLVKDSESDYCFTNHNDYINLISLTSAPYSVKSDQISMVKSVEKNKIEEIKDENGNITPKIQLPKRIQKASEKKMKIEKDDNLINTMDPEDKDPDITKIEDFCDGLIDYNDLNPEEFLQKHSD